MFCEQLENLRRKTPLIHCITNYVTVNDCANILLACGASPIMADDPQEVEEIAELCDGMVLNIGTLNRATIPAMTAAGKTATAFHRPVVLDPVGRVPPACAPRRRGICCRRYAPPWCGAICPRSRRWTGWARRTAWMRTWQTR